MPLFGSWLMLSSLSFAGSLMFTRRRVKQLSTDRMFSLPPRPSMTHCTSAAFFTLAFLAGAALLAVSVLTSSRPGVWMLKVLISRVNTTKYTAIWHSASRYRMG